MNFGRNFAKIGDFGHVRNFLTNEIQNPGERSLLPMGDLPLSVLVSQECLERLKWKW